MRTMMVQEKTRLKAILTIGLICSILINPLIAEKSKVRKPFPNKETIEALPADGGPEFNRLVFEQSPYLLQHARNPIDWFPWGEEAFEKAKAEDKMVFLSIGYSTCHWCHVMEHESFEDEDVAALMNKVFVNIKVDREERPDLDNIYMTVTQAMTGSGGWPMTVVLTPDKKPFFAGTYFPKNGKYGRAGMMELIPQLEQVWNTKRKDALDYADSLVNELQKMSNQPAGDGLNPEILKEAYSELSASFDEDKGGFRAQRKFPLPHNLLFLLRYWDRTGEDRALYMVEKSLQAMRFGGLWDHVGFGTHRYSTDPDFLLPHFEKMLYDQALLAMAHVEAFQITGKEFYKNTAEEIFTYVLRDMTSPEGGFFSAEDADSEGEEGLFYTWTADEVKFILGKDEGKEFMSAFRMKSGGNFFDEATGHQSERNIPHLPYSTNTQIDESEFFKPEFQAKWDKWRNTLFTEREKRIHPLKDDKILTDWNGLMVAAFAKAGMAFQDEKYTEVAQRAADFLLTKLRKENGELYKRYRNGSSGLTAHLEDYAFLAWGIIEVYHASGEPKYLEESKRIADKLIDLFHDEKNSGFFLTADNAEKLITRAKEIYDGAIPSGNSVAAYVLARLAKLTGDTKYDHMAQGVFQAFTTNVKRGPSNFAMLMTAFDFASGPTSEVVVVEGGLNTQSFQETVDSLQKEYLPRTVIVAKSNASASALDKLAPFSSEQKSIGSKLTIYVCENYTCKQPVHTLKDTKNLLNNLKRSNKSNLKLDILEK